MHILDKELDKEHFFQTDASIHGQKERLRRSENLESEWGPAWFKASSQVLSLSPGPSSSMFVSESGFLFKQVSLQSGKVLRSFRGHQGPVTCLLNDQESAPGFVFSGSWDKSIRKWDIETGKQIQIFEGHMDFVKSLCLTTSENGHVFLLSGSSDKTIRVWDVASGECLKKFEGHRRGIESIVHVYGTGFIFSASSDGTIRKWDTGGSGDCVHVISSENGGHLTNVYKLKIADEYEIWSASADETVCCWDLQTLQRSQSYKHPEQVKAFDLIEHLGKRYLITGCRDGNLRVWDILEGTLVGNVEAHLDEISSIVSTLDGFVQSGSYDATVRRWNIKDLLNPSHKKPKEPANVLKTVEMTKEEEQELADLMDE